MHHHCSGRSIGKPPLIQDHKRLTCACEIPFSVTPKLHPCVVVITVGPPWHIHLPRRNSHTPKCIYQKNRLLTAASVTSSIYRKCRKCTVITTMISSFLRTPVIYLNCRIFRIFSFNSILQLIPEKASTRKYLFLIHPVIQNIIQKHLLRQLFHPVQRIIKKQPMTCEILNLLKSIIHKITIRRGHIQILHCQPQISAASIQLLTNRLQRLPVRSKLLC